MIATGADLCTTGHRVPGRVSPLDAGSVPQDGLPRLSGLRTGRILRAYNSASVRRRTTARGGHQGIRRTRPVLQTAGARPAWRRRLPRRPRWLRSATSRPKRARGLHCARPTWLSLPFRRGANGGANGHVSGERPSSLASHKRLKAQRPALVCAGRAGLRFESSTPELRCRRPLT